MVSMVLWRSVVAALTSMLIQRPPASVEASPTLLRSSWLPLRLMRLVVNRSLSRQA
jgi:hypothetical protein